MKPRSAKAKGTLLEKRVMLDLQRAGAAARKQPGSGIYSAFPADVYAEIPLIGPVLIECKSHKSPLATIRKWLGKATVLVHKANFEEPLVTIPLAHYCELVSHLAEADRRANHVPERLTNEEITMLYTGNAKAQVASHA
jgi:Holliday junction resolvase